MPPGSPDYAAAAGGPVAVCTLSDTDLAATLRECPGVGLAGPLLTANLGIEQVIWAILDHPNIRYLLVCGPDSPLFHAGQSLVALVCAGIRASDQRIIGAVGYMPFLRGVDPAEVTAFRGRVELADLRGESDAERLRKEIGTLANAAAPPVRADGQPGAPVRRRREFITVRPRGRREPVAKSGGGFFVVSIDGARRQIVLEHYLPDFNPGHQMRGTRAESMLLGLISAGLVDCLSHAGYLGAELAKAETALRLGLDYQQDRPLRRAGTCDPLAAPAERTAGLSARRGGGPWPHCALRSATSSATSQGL